MAPDSDLEKIKALYDENATQFRFFLTWRQLLLAGYFAVVAALAVAFKWFLADAHAYVFVCPFIGAGISLLFWALDSRNRELYKISGTVGVALEKELGYTGYYGEYDHTTPSKVRHAIILSAFYIVSGSLMFLVGILSFLVDLTITVPAAPK